MNEREFFYWLKGALQLSGYETLDEKQMKILKEQMDLVVKSTTNQYCTITSIPSIFGSQPNSTTILPNSLVRENTCEAPVSNGTQKNPYTISTCIPFTENQWGVDLNRHLYTT